MISFVTSEALWIKEKGEFPFAGKLNIEKFITLYNILFYCNHGIAI